MHKKNKICLLYVIITSIIISISVYGLIEKKYNLEKVYIEGFIEDMSIKKSKLDDFNEVFSLDVKENNIKSALKSIEFSYKKSISLIILLNILFILIILEIYRRINKELLSVKELKVEVE
nr:hypothetical protein [Clostridium paraputrificum]